MRMLQPRRAAFGVLVACAATGLIAPMQPAYGQVSPVRGAAGTSRTVDDEGLEHCDKPMGAVAVVEPQGNTLGGLSRHGLSSPTPLLRLMIQQSNCFIVVERGVGMRSMMQERDLAATGETRKGANMGGGMMMAADFVLTPSVVFTERDAGGVGGTVGGLLGRKAPVVALAHLRAAPAVLRQHRQDHKAARHKSR
jgi:curli biogenesis system outer membrane secretion channel CsgG